MKLNLTDKVDAYERKLMLEALERCRGVQVNTAKELGIPLTTFRYKMRKHGIKVTRKEYR